MDEKWIKDYLNGCTKEALIELYLQMRFERDLYMKMCQSEEDNQEKYKLERWCPSSCDGKGSKLDLVVELGEFDTYDDVIEELKTLERNGYIEYRIYKGKELIERGSFTELLEPLLPNGFEIRMQRISKSIALDTETKHSEADKLMCMTLKSLGYDAGVKIFEDMYKWYS